MWIFDKNDRVSQDKWMLLRQGGTNILHRENFTRQKKDVSFRLDIPLAI